MYWLVLYLVGAVCSTPVTVVHSLKSYKAGKYEQESRLLTIASSGGGGPSAEALVARDVILYAVFWPLVIPCLGILHMGQRRIDAREE